MENVTVKLSGSQKPSLSDISARSSITCPSLYCWSSLCANSYIHPSLVLHRLHVTSRTKCLPVSIVCLNNKMIEQKFNFKNIKSMGLKYTNEFHLNKTTELEEKWFTRS